MNAIRSTLMFAVCTLLALPAVSADVPPPVEAVRPAKVLPRRQPVESPKPLPPIGWLVEQLGSPKFSERAMATRYLGRSGVAAVEPLMQAALSDQPEVSIRALAALEAIWLRALEEDDDDAGRAALAALDTLSASEDRVLRTRVEAMLALYEQLVFKYALSELVRMGATIRFDTSQSDINEDGTLRPIVKHVVVGLRWSGGEEGLRHVMRVSPGGVYFIKGAKLPEGTHERFQAASGIQVAVRGAAFLGVSSSQQIQGIEGVFVESAEVNTPAAKAGIRQGDVIVKFDGEDVKNFQQLVLQIEKTQPGKSVAATIIRQGEPVELTIEMEEWK